MQPVSAAFLAAIASSDQTMANRIDVLVKGKVQTGLDVQLVDGSVTFDRSRSIWRDADVIIKGSGGLVPDTLADPLAPNGVELQLWRGIPGELASLGIFVLEEPLTSDTGANWEIELKAVDRSARVQWANFADTFVIPAGTNAAAAIRLIVTSGVPGLAYKLAPTAEVTPLHVYDGGSSRWEAAQGIATDLGWELFFDASGALVGRPVPDPATSTPVYTFVEGSGGIVQSATRRMSRVGTANVQIVTGENPNNQQPYRGTAADVDPTSPTYIGNPPGSSTFGLVTEEEQRTGVTSTAMAQAAAVAKLRGSRHAIEEVDGISLVNSALEPDDIVALTKSRLRLASDHYILHTGTIPLRGKDLMPWTLLRNPAVAVTEL